MRLTLNLNISKYVDESPYSLFLHEDKSIEGKKFKTQIARTETKSYIREEKAFFRGTKRS